MVAEGRTRTDIKCPKDFSLESNFEGVVRVLEQIRTVSKRPKQRMYIDFRDIENVSSSAALVLAAELDRCNKLKINRRTPLRAVDVDQWNSRVRRLLAGMGFFELLNVTTPLTNWDSKGTNATIQYVKFRTGTKAEGEAIYQLQTQNLEPVVGTLPRHSHLYAAVTEAMTNVVHHAYKSGTPRPNWWLSASYDTATSQVKIMIYDQGVGIPKTLPRLFGEQIRMILPNDHARMIMAAHQLKRSASGAPHRGHGLRRDVRGYLAELAYRGYYRVTSLKGEYLFERNPGGIDQDRVKNNPRALPGTLIEWELHLN